ncbi:MAG: FtsK/SpoIIIE domain-containing protein [Planctomycetaceae bacterium]
MESSQITVSSQLKLASEGVLESEACQRQLQQLQSELRQLAQTLQDDLRRIENESAERLHSGLQQIDEQATARREAVELDYRNRLESLQVTQQRTLHDASADHYQKLADLEERRRSETWILQSVLDEETDDSPVTRFEREADAFINQKAYVDERFADLEKQLQQTTTFLEACHVTPSPEQPPAAPLKGLASDELRDIAMESAGLVQVESDRLRLLHRAQWVKGFRLWGVCFLLFLILWVSLIAVRADLRQFLNPELSNPDWNWVGVSALAALVVAVVTGVLFLVSVQGTLRRQFQQIRQHHINAEHSRRHWEQKTERSLARLSEVSESWRRKLDDRRRAQHAKIQSDFEQQTRNLHETLQRLHDRSSEELKRLSDQAQAETASAVHQIETQRHQSLEAFQQQVLADERTAAEDSRAAFLSATEELRRKSDELLIRWKQRVDSLRSLAQSAVTFAAATRRWPDAPDWALPQMMPNCLSVGDVLMTVPQVPATADGDLSSRLCLEMPAVLRFPADTSILVEHDAAGRERALGFLRTQLLKLLTVIPAGRVRLTLIDPIGLGQSFSAMMHLADFDELLIHSRIWTDSSQIRQQLQKVTEHMENIFQTYLRSQFETIEEYNASAGEVAEPYHFVVIAGFPSAFTEESGRHLSSILTSGPRCGVHALIAWNPAQGVPQSFDADELRHHCIRFQVRNNQLLPMASLPSAVVFEAYPEPPATDYVRTVRQVGEQSKDARRVEVSFTRIAPRHDEIWTHSSADGIDLPIGRAGAARLQFMRLGRGTSQHVLIAGKTGSGKSTFLHILITNLALHYGPDEIQFYLIDFKKGVEFRTYAAHRLPHARVVAIESDREFGLSVLERLDEILQERGELFRDRGVQDVPGFREQFPNEPMPRLLLLVDEFQEFFVAEDRVSARASLLLDRLVRQGRAFGIHILLGSQTLGGAYSLARSTMGQIAVRIALQCSESDAHLILSEDNVAARMLTRPGEAIYNDANGLVQGNHQFQVAWLDEARREEAIRTMLSHDHAAAHDRRMVVFEGNVPPVVEHCQPLNALLKSEVDATRRPTDALTVWLGEPVAIAAPTSLEFRRASGQNLLIVGQDESQVDSLLACLILSICCRPGGEIPDDGSRLTLLQDGRADESMQRFAGLQNSLCLDNTVLSGPDDCDAVIQHFHQEVTLREQNPDLTRGSERLLVVRNIGQFRSLRKDEDDFGLGGFGEPKAATSATMFADLLKRGPLVGIHVVVWADTFSNAVRWLSNSLLREFESRIAFRMNQTDSASLVDTPVAASLTAGRALIYRDQTGTIEKFRPFAWPSESWLASLNRCPDSPPSFPFDIDSLTIE